MITHTSRRVRAQRAARRKLHTSRRSAALLAFLHAARTAPRIELRPLTRPVLWRQYLLIGVLGLLVVTSKE